MSGLVESSNQLISEEEVCQKLIELSFVKIVNSKHERGGAKLHKNMMILHLLQKARLEHRRSSESPTEMELGEFETVSPSDEDRVELAEEAREVHFEECSVKSQADLNRRIESQDFSDEPNLQEEGEGEHDGPPPLLRFVSVEEEDEDVSVEISSSDLPATSSEYGNFIPLFTSENPNSEFYPQPPKVIVQTEEDYYYYANSWDILEERSPEEAEEEDAISSTFTIISTKSKSKSASTDDSGFSSASSSSSSSSEEEDESSEGDSDDSRRQSRDWSTGSTPSCRRRRKRKHCSPNNNGNSKKTCCSDQVDTVQLSGLISVFRQTEIAENVCEKSEFCVRLKKSRNSYSAIKTMGVPGEEGHGSGSCGAETGPSRSLSCPSLLELACRS